MKKRLLKKRDISGVIARLATQGDVFAPVMSEGNILFQQVKDVAPIAQNYVNSKDAPKGFFFPHTETMMRYRRTDKGMELVEASVEDCYGEAGNGEADNVRAGDAEVPRRVLFNVRPCDARSFVLLDMLFDQDKYSDKYYVAKRKNTTVIVNACAAPISKNCFCTSVGLSPTGTDGADVLMLDIGDEYLVEFVTHKGEALLDCFGGAEADGEAESKARAVRERAGKLVDASVPAKSIKPILDKSYEHPIWESIPQRCLACGTCTYLCPTCHCFDISDEVKGDDGVRIRNWDSCMYPLFTKETSGHNTRPSQKSRWRQRTMHKFKYYVDNFDAISCVGCGRCVAYCPVNIDIRQVVKEISKL